MVTNANLHFNILTAIIDNGFAPSADQLANMLNASVEDIEQGLLTLQEYHGVVLHPNSFKVWVIHPFSLAPTHFYVQSETGEWWGNCAWCSLGVAAILKQDVLISTVIGGQTKPIQINIRDGAIVESNYCIHFPIPMQQAWDNVIYTCSTMLVFESESQVDEWCSQHNIPKGDVQPIDKIWAFAQAWYGNHLNPNWQKWTIQEAKELFDRFGLQHEVWALGNSEERF